MIDCTVVSVWMYVSVYSFLYLVRVCVYVWVCKCTIFLHACVHVFGWEGCVTSNTFLSNTICLNKPNPRWKSWYGTSVITLILVLGERERRKGQLLELQKSKQERTESELSHIRNLYERQQKETALLQLNFENTKDLLALHQKQNLPGYVAKIFEKHKSSYCENWRRSTFFSIQFRIIQRNKAICHRKKRFGVLLYLSI